MADLSANFVISPISANFVAQQVSANFVVEKSIAIDMAVEGVYVANGYNNKAMGPNTAVQFNIGNALTGDANLLFNPTTATLTASKINSNLVSNLANITVANISNLVLDGASSIHIGGGSNRQVLQTNGNGNLSWANVIVSAAGNLGDDDVANTQLRVVNFYANGKVELGSSTDVIITGGSPDYVLSTDGSGGLSWRPATPTLPAGANFQVQYNISNIFTASNAFTFNPTTNTLSATKFVGDGHGVSNVAWANTSNVANTVSVAAQPNITSVGTLTSLDVSGVANLGTVSNVKIGGGSVGYYLQTDGTGNLVWSAAGGGSGIPGGLNTFVQFNDTGLFAGSANFTFDKTTNSLSVSHLIGEGGNISNISSANIVGNVANATYASNAGWANTSNSANYSANSNIANVANVAYSVSYANVTGIGNVSSVNLNGNVSTVLAGDGTWVPKSGDANFANFAGNVTLAAQPNITSVGTLTALTVEGVANLGGVANLRVTGGTFGQVLYSDGAGGLFWGAAGGGGGATGGAAQIDYRFTGSTANSAAIGRDETITWIFTPDYVPHAKTGPGAWTNITSNIVGNGSITGVAASDTQAVIIQGYNGGTDQTVTQIYTVAANNQIVKRSNITFSTANTNATFNDPKIVYDSVGGNYIITRTGYIGTTPTIFNSKSTDGITWTQGTNAQFPGNTVGQGAYQDNKIINGNLYMWGDFSSIMTKCSTSMSGFSSMSVTNLNTFEYVAGFPADRRWWQICTGATAQTPTLRYSSSDFGSYTTVSPVNLGSVRSCATNGTFLLVWGGKASDPLIYKYVFKSVDGTNWYDVSPGLSPQDGEINTMYYDGTRFIISTLAGTSGARILTSTDGENWTEQQTTNTTIRQFSKWGEIDIGVGKESDRTVWIGGGVPATEYLITLPAHGSYTTQYVSFLPTVGFTAEQQASSLGSAITAVRSTYNVTYPSAGYVTIDTNSSGNIPDVSMSKTGGNTVGNLTFTVNHGANGATYTRDTVTLRDPTTGSTFIYSPGYSESLSTVVNSIVGTETIPNWSGSVSSANSIQGTARFTKSTNGYTAPSERLSITVTQGSGSTLQVTETLVNAGY